MLTHSQRYEHFERDDETAERPVVVFRWESRTEIAE